MKGMLFVVGIFRFQTFESGEKTRWYGRTNGIETKAEALDQMSKFDIEIVKCQYKQWMLIIEKNEHFVTQLNECIRLILYLRTHTSLHKDFF